MIFFQNIRKDSGFEVTDKIKVQLKRSGLLEEAILENEAYIKSETKSLFSLSKFLFIKFSISRKSQIGRAHV